MLDAGLLDVYLLSPNKRRRHSDSNMTLVLPTPRGNMKGSLSLEGETRHEDKEDDSSQPSTSALKRSPKLSHSDTGDDLEWTDPFSPSPLKSQHHFFQSSAETCIAEHPGIKRNQSIELTFSSERDFDAAGLAPLSGKGSLNGRGQTTEPRERRSATTDLKEADDSSSVKGFLVSYASQDSTEASVLSDDVADRETSLDLFEDNGKPPLCAMPPAAVESSIKQSRKMWYKHKYFSTPVHDEVDKTMKPEIKPGLGLRSSSLPLPESYPEDFLSPDLFASTDSERNLPLITVSSPSDQASESQVSDETNVTVVLSSGDPSDSDDFPSDHASNSGTNPTSLRPSVICSPPKPEGCPHGEMEKEKSEVKKREFEKNNTRCISTSENRFISGFEPSGWIDCSKRKSTGNRVTVVPQQSSLVELRQKQNVYKLSKTEECDTSNKNTGTKISSSDFVDLASDSDWTPNFSQDNNSATQLSKQASDSLPSSSRSSCLKTARRTQDHVEVVTLDHHPL